ncbi:MAG TPA: TonB-dependent receptor [Methylovirgula sp.]|nr:TonB-dependent receptor [Methylovirgula sp.]
MAGKGSEAGYALTAACVIAASSFTNAEAQQASPAPAPAAAPSSSTLPAVTVEAPQKKKQRVVASKPTQAQLRARAALRRKQRQAAAQRATPTPGPSSSLPIMAQVPPDADPYANPAAPYQATRMSSSKFSEPIADTPRSITVLTHQVLEDQNATSLRDIGRTTAGVTLGSGEGGNAFGDRFFIRGFDARNDIFVDGVRDPGVSIRENFFTEEVEIMRGPASSLAGRGTTGGAINIVTKQAGFRDFYNAESTLGSDQTRRLTLDVNKAISPVLAVRLDGMIQGANVAGRDFTTDNRNGLAGAVTFQPTPNFVVKGDYSHTYLYGLPDFGVPYDPSAHGPVTSVGIVPRNTYYGIVNRDFTKTMQNIGTLDAQYTVTPWLTLENKFRQGYSTLNYIGTIPENPSATGATAPFSSTPYFFSGFVQLNAQSRYETVNVLEDQPQATFKFNTGPIEHTTILGGEFSGQRVSSDTYTGLTSELATGPAAFASTGAPIVSVTDPTNYLTGLGAPTLTGNPQIYHVNTNAAYLLETANWRDKIIFNTGVRFDDYHITSSNNTASVSADNGIVSYNFGLVYKPIPITSLYAAYATAADPVGDELDAAASSYGGLAPGQPPSQIFGPQRSQAAEIGNKWELFDKRMLVTGALFQTTVENARETAPNGLPGYTSGQVVAGASYKVQGIDLEAAGKITDKWSLMGGLVLMKSEVTHSIVPTNIGLQLANVAHQSFNLLSKYEVTPWLEFGGMAIYDSKILGGSLLAANGGVTYPNAPNPTILPAHWRFDTFVEAKVAPYTTLKLYVQNLFNRTYYDSVYQSSQPFLRVAPGRTVSLIATAKF